MPYYTEKQIDQARSIDLLTYLQTIRIVQVMVSKATLYKNATLRARIESLRAVKQSKPSSKEEERKRRSQEQDLRKKIFAYMRSVWQNGGADSNGGTCESLGLSA